MTYREHWRISCQGTVANEPLSFGVSVVGDVGIPDAGFGDFASLTDVVQQARTDFTTFLNSIVQYQSTDVKWTGLKITEYNGSGEVTGAAESNFTSVISGTGSPGLPPFLALVATLITDRPGRRYRGRIYLPLGPSTALTARQASVSCTQDTAQSVSTLLTNLNNAPGLDTRWNALKCVVSSKMGSGHNEIIKRVRVNSLVDTQRRRQNATAPTTVSVYNVGGA